MGRAYIASYEARVELWSMACEYHEKGLHTCAVIFTANSCMMRVHECRSSCSNEQWLITMVVIGIMRCTCVPGRSVLLHDKYPTYV